VDSGAIAGRKLTLKILVTPAAGALITGILV
jgi:hypothetical protein